MKLDINFVWLQLFYRARDLYVSAGADLLESPSFLIAPATGHLRTVLCYFGTKIYAKHLVVNPSFLCSISRSSYRSQIEEAFGFPFWTSKVPRQYKCIEQADAPVCRPSLTS